jgi:hypothetical protein
MFSDTEMKRKTERLMKGQNGAGGLVDPMGAIDHKTSSFRRSVSTWNFAPGPLKPGPDLCE